MMNDFQGCAVSTELNREQDSIEAACERDDEIHAQFLREMPSEVNRVQAYFAEDFQAALNEAVLEDKWHEDLLIALQGLCKDEATEADLIKFRVALYAYCTKRAASDLIDQYEREQDRAN